MESLAPASFAEALAGVLAAGAMLLLSFSLAGRYRQHAARIAAVLLITAIALFADNWLIYMLAVLVVATAVTELEFIQTIAAIVRRSPEYFDYKKEQLSPREKERRFREEAPAPPAAGGGPGGQGGSLTYTALEQALFPVLANHLGKDIERSMRFESPIKGGIEFDGVIANDDGPDLLIEVKHIRSAVQLERLEERLSEYEARVIRYLRITGRAARMQLVLVADTASEPVTRLVHRIRKRAAERERIAGVSFFTLAELGLGAAAPTTSTSAPPRAVPAPASSPPTTPPSPS